MPKRQVHIIGIDHIIQHNSFAWRPEVARAIAEFQQHLREMIKTTGARLLAEEFSDEAAARNKVEISTVGKIAQEMAIDHLYCDPGTAEREQLGTCDVDARENYWARKLLLANADQILFICGDKHIVTIPAVLKRHGFQTAVVSIGWGCNLIRITKLSDLVGEA